MKIKKNLLVNFFVIIIFFITGFFLLHNTSNPTPSPIPEIRGGVGERSEDIKQVKIAGQNIKVDLALTSAVQAQGLSGRASLAEDQGMLFIFDTAGNYPFWMKDMNFAIDIIWLSEDLKVIYIKKDARPELFPETYGPNKSMKNTKYVLEVVSGFAEKNNLKVGDKIEFVY